MKKFMAGLVLVLVCALSLSNCMADGTEIKDADIKLTEESTVVSTFWLANGNLAPAKLTWYRQTTGAKEIVYLTFQIDNQSSYTIRNIEVMCGNEGEDGTVSLAKKSILIPDTIEPSKNLIREHINTGLKNFKPDTTACAIIDFSIVK